MGLLSKCVRGVVTFILAFSASAEPPPAASAPTPGERKILLRVPAEPLPTALKDVGDAFELNVLFGNDVGVDIISRELRGTYTVSAALNQLLKNTGLEFQQVGPTTITVRQSETSVRKYSFRKTTGKSKQTVPREVGNVDNTDVVVTGSRLKDSTAADSSAQRVYDQDAIDQSGAATVSELSEVFPESFNSVNPVSSLFGNTVGAPQLGNNAFLGRGFNLSGLGPEATLTLLDGDRWASGGASGTFLDISVLPINAIASIVTLTGDTSAVYGSDAIAGVVNILLRSGTDKDRNETRIRYGTTWDGGGGQWVFSQRLGEKWMGGNGMVAYQRAQQSGVLSNARSYIPSISPEIDIVPRLSSSGLLGKLEHQFAEGTLVKVHFLYGARDVTADSSGFVDYRLGRDSPAREYGGNVHIDQRLTPEWTIALYGSYSTLAQSLTATAYRPGMPPANQNQPGNSSLGELALSANAKPITLYGHDLTVALGAGGREETVMVPTSLYRTSYTSLARKVGNVYVEMLLPLVSGSHALLRRLELSLVAREDYYEAVGPTLNPKAGIVWSPVSKLSFRSTFARSFRPPSLDDLAAIPFYYAVNIPDGTSHTGFTDALVNQSQGISGLRPEIARTITGGLDYRRNDSGGWAGSATWFRTVFDNRVATPLGLASSGNPTTDIFAQPALAPYVSRAIDPTQIQAIFASPSFAQDFVGSGAAGVRATFDDELTNIVRSLEEGLEASVCYSTGDRPNQLSAFLIGNYLLRDIYRLTPGAPMASLANNIGQMPNLRARGGVTGSWNRWRATLNVNYTNGYHNALVTPQQPVRSWTTADFQLAWQLPVPIAPDLRLIFNARNVLNTRPPWVSVPAGISLRPVGFDAANASVLGRMLSMELSVTW